MPSIKKTDVYVHEIRPSLFREAIKAYKSNPILGVSKILLDLSILAIENPYGDDDMPSKFYLSNSEMKTAQKAVASCPAWSKKLSKYKIETKPRIVEFPSSFRVGVSSSNPIDMLIGHGLAPSGFEGKELVIQKDGPQNIVKVELIEDYRGWHIRAYCKKKE